LRNMVVLAQFMVIQVLYMVFAIFRCVLTTLAPLSVTVKDMPTLTSRIMALCALIRCTSCHHADHATSQPEGYNTLPAPPQAYSALLTSLSFNICLSWLHCEKRRVNLTKLWSPQLHLSGHLHVVIKEHELKCNPYFDPISISDLKKKSVARSRFSVSGN